MKWRPIKTAPKDGADILLCRPGERARLGFWNDGSSCWHAAGTFEYDPMDPVYWMPLPEPPRR
jgi:hypothetical protein